MFWEYPEEWDDYLWRAGPDKQIPQAKAKAQELLSRPGALELVSKPPEPVPLPQTQGPLFSILPPELRTWIFELVVTREDRILLPSLKASDATRNEAYPPALARVSRLVRRETLPLSFRCNHFFFDTICTSKAYCSNHSTIATDRLLLKWLAPMAPHLPLLHHITIQIPRYEDAFPMPTYSELSDNHPPP